MEGCLVCESFACVGEFQVGEGHEQAAAELAEVPHSTCSGSAAACAIPILGVPPRRPFVGVAFRGHCILFGGLGPRSQKHRGEKNNGVKTVHSMPRCICKVPGGCFGPVYRCACCLALGIISILIQVAIVVQRKGMKLPDRDCKNISRQDECHSRNLSQRCFSSLD